MKRAILPLFAALLVAGLGACEENTPTAVDPDLFPVRPRTVEIRLPWDQFGRELTVYSGFGLPSELAHGFLAKDFEGVVTARTLAKLGPLPDSATVVVDGASVRSAVTFGSGRLVARIDTLGSLFDGPVTVTARAMRTNWERRTVSWDVAVDTPGVFVPWPEPGGGVADSLASATWDPADTLTGDSVVIEIDSADIALWEDDERDVRGVRLDAETTGSRLEILSLALRLDGNPELREDTVVPLTVGGLDLGFVADPSPDEVVEGGIRVGGIPALRTVVRMDIPTTLTGPPSLCEAVGCPFVLDADRVNSAAMILTTAESPRAYRPADTFRLDARIVLVPERLPKAPLGPSFTGAVTAGRAVAPAAFDPDGAAEVSLPVTAFVRDLVRGETARGDEPSDALAVLTFLEPIHFGVASFVPPGEPGEPFLRLIVTTADTVEVR